ncbi:MAG: XRE family plasmid maintenance system antidote protein [uncultured bacterium]|nr:MAG: XRE family plasmid maintenance system antidote protein [uncultured bacterium]HBH18985.1 addiction module antidote protein, HigA family [Cyanobacteria bacterium UBA9579]
MSMKNPVHPGILIKDNIETLGLSVTEFALKLGVSRQIVSRIINQKAGVSVEMALKLAKAFNTTPEFWLNMQQKYDLAQARQTVNVDKIQKMYG